MLKVFFFLVFLGLSQELSQERRGNIARNEGNPPPGLGTVGEWKSSTQNSSNLSAIYDRDENSFIQIQTFSPYVSKYLIVEDFQFNIPLDSKLEQISLEITRSKDESADAADLLVSLKYGDITSRNEKNNSTFPVSIKTISYTFSPEEWGLPDIQPSDIMNASFGIQYAVGGGHCVCSGLSYLYDLKITVGYAEFMANDTTATTSIDTTGTTSIDTTGTTSIDATGTTSIETTNVDTSIATDTTGTTSIDTTDVGGTTSISDNGKKSSKNDDQTGLIIGVVVGVSILFLFSFICAWFFLKRKKNQEPSNAEMNVSADLAMSVNDRLEGVEVKYRIGGGNFGDVYKGEWSGSPVALKKLKESNQYTEFHQEWKILKSVNHPNIVRFYGIFLSQKEYYLVMEYVECGGLDQFLIQEKSKIGVVDLLAMTHQIILGMKHLQEKKIIHRDLGLRNLLLSKEFRNEKQKYIVKIADFGMSRQQNIYSSTNDKMPVKWTAPEALRFSQFSVKSDIWSFGIVLWELFSFAEIPYSAMSNQEVLEKVVNGYRLSPPSNCPSFVSNLMSQCWEEDPNYRPDFFQTQTFFEENWRNTLAEEFVIENKGGGIPNNVSDFYNC